MVCKIYLAILKRQKGTKFRCNLGFVLADVFVNNTSFADTFANKLKEVLGQLFKLLPNDKCNEAEICHIPLLCGLNYS